MGETHLVISKAMYTTKKSREVVNNWHVKLSHSSPAVLKFILNKMYILCDTNSLFLYKSCEIEKIQRLPLQPANQEGSYSLQLIDSDVWGLHLFYLLKV